MRERGEDPVANIERSIRADNAVIAGFPGVTFGMHICRGNSGGRGGAGWHREGSYDEIAERLFTGLKFDRFLLEYDCELSGTFDALRFFPKDRVAVLGLISNHGEVETAGVPAPAAGGGVAATSRWTRWRSARAAASAPRTKTCSGASSP